MINLLKITVSGYKMLEDDFTVNFVTKAKVCNDIDESEINKIRNETTYDDVVLIANGDMFQGTAISNTTYGLSVIESMNKMGFV